MSDKNNYEYYDIYDKNNFNGECLIYHFYKDYYNDLGQIMILKISLNLFVKIRRYSKTVKKKQDTDYDIDTIKNMYNNNFFTKFIFSKIRYTNSLYPDVFRNLKPMSC